MVKQKNYRPRIVKEFHDKSAKQTIKVYSRKGESASDASKRVITKHQDPKVGQKKGK